MKIPRFLTAELTYRCPLQCPYCSNPLQMAKFNKELKTDEWISIFQQARKMGVIQLGLTGGEPLIRTDLNTLVKEANKLGFYSNLITSAVGLTEKKLNNLKKNGLDSIQVSFQAENKELSNKIAGLNSFEHKMKMIKKVKEYDFPLTLNVVLHKHNLDNIRGILDLCISLSPDYIELANTQYHGWAFKNRKSLMPTINQINIAKKITEEYQNKYKQIGIIYVIPDYLEGKPKPCMGGWGNEMITVNPEGNVMPCLSASIIKDLKYENIKTSNLKDIYYNSDSFNKYRGLSWMTKEQRDRPTSEIDFGGCRCQAYQITGNASEIDPVCKSSKHHSKLMDYINEETNNNLIYRNMKNSKKEIN